MGVMLSPVDLVQADDTPNPAPASGYVRLFAKPDGRLYARDSGGSVTALEVSTEDLLVALGRITAALQLLGIDPSLIDAGDGLAALE